MRTAQTWIVVFCLVWCNNIYCTNSDANMDIMTDATALCSTNSELSLGSKLIKDQDINRAKANNGSQTSTTNEIDAKIDALNINSLINIDLLQTAHDKEFVHIKHKQLTNNGILYVSNFMSEAGLSFLDKLYELSAKFEQTIYNRITIYPFDCPSDQINATISWIEQATKSSFLWSTKLLSKYQKDFEKIYHYQPFRTLLSSIILNSYEKSGDLNYVYDEDSHLYFHVQRGSPHNEFTAWHYDEHHFTCAILVSQGEFGGQFNYLQYRNTTGIDSRDTIQRSHLSNKNARVTNYDNYWNDEKIEHLLNISVDTGITKNLFETKIVGNNHIQSVEVKRGDLYCFFGNESLHSVTQVSGQGTRISLIMSMAFGDEFVHTGGAVMSLHSNDSYIDIDSN